jgi:hypothetical protein
LIFLLAGGASLSSMATGEIQSRNETGFRAFLERGEDIGN